METRTVYVTWVNQKNEFKSDTVEITGKINHLSVQNALQERLGTLTYSTLYDVYDFKQVIAWSIEEEFTFDEKSDFYKKKY